MGGRCWGGVSYRKIVHLILQDTLAGDGIVALGGISRQDALESPFDCVELKPTLLICWDKSPCNYTGTATRVTADNRMALVPTYLR
jgi:hypothetical protein